MGFRGKNWSSVVVGVIFSLLVGQGAGCRLGPRISALQEENRQLEERLYQIAELLAECRRENRRLRQELSAREELPADKERTSEAGRAAPAQTPDAGGEGHLPKIRVEGVPQPDVKGELPRPEVPGTTPREGGPSDTTSTSVDNPRTSRSSVTSAVAAASLSPREPFSGVRQADSREVYHVEVNPQFTGGWDADGRRGDEGITVLIEPRDSAGRLLRVAAPIGVVVVDPALPGEDARLARWDLSAQEVAESFVQMPSHTGILLHLPWREKVPIHSRLHLFVRLITSDGRKLQSDLPIQVELLPVVTGEDSSEAIRGGPDAELSPRGESSGTWLEVPQDPRAARRPPVWSPVR